MFKVPEKYRIVEGENSTEPNSGNNGSFKIYLRGDRTNLGSMLFIQSSDINNWERVSVNTPVRFPTWEEMCLVRNLFWDKNDLIVQYFPREKDCNTSRYTLYLWRPTNQVIPSPTGALI